MPDRFVQPLNKKVDRFAGEVKKLLPEGFYVDCRFIWWLHAVRCVVWNEHEGVPQWEVKWTVENLDDMEYTKRIVLRALKAINKERGVLNA